MTVNPNPIDTLIPAPAVRAILGGVTDMTLHRWLKGDYDRRTGRTTPPVEGFPRPRMINNRRYWSRAEIEEFMRPKDTQITR